MRSEKHCGWGRVGRMLAIGCAAALVVGCSKTQKEQTGPVASAPDRPAPGTMVVYDPVPIPPLAEGAAGPNALINGDFEKFANDSPEGWSVLPAEAARAETSLPLVASGDRSLRIEGVASCELKQTINVTGKTMYQARALVRGKGDVRTEARDAEGGAARFAAQGEKTTLSENEWTLVSLSFEPPLFTKRLQLVLASSLASDGNGAVWWDRAELKATPIARNNLLQNAGFEEWRDGRPVAWNIMDTQGVKQGSGSEPFLEGSASLMVNCDASANLGIAQEVSGLVPGASYLLRAYVKSRDVAGQAGIEVQHGEKGYQAFCRFSEPAVSGTQDWTLTSISFAVPGDTDKMLVFLRRPAPESSPGGTGTLWFDGCELSILPASAP